MMIMKIKAKAPLNITLQQLMEKERKIKVERELKDKENFVKELQKEIREKNLR
jgi:hypothetical protein